MRTVLFIAYYYPPSIDAGAKRAEGFARYLPEYGYSPVVLTVRDGNYQTTPGVHPPDPDNVVRVPEAGFLPRRSRRASMTGAAPVQISNGAKLFRRIFREMFYIPDGYAGFHGPALRKGLQLIRDRSVDSILTTSSPFSLLHTGSALQKRSKRPWVADLRDLWINSHFEYPLSPIRRFIDQRLERRWLGSAARITTATGGLASVLRENGYGGIPIDTILNGYLDLPPGVPEKAPRADRLTVSFTGTLHEMEEHTANPLLDAIAGMATPASVRVVFYGSVASHFLPSVQERGLAEVVQYAGRVSRESAQIHQRESDLLLLLIPDTMAQRASLPSKTFDYLGSDRAILAILPEDGEAGRLLRKLGVTRIFAPSDVAGIRRCLEEAVESKRRLGQVPSGVNPALVRGFHYKTLAGEMARSLDAALEGGAHTVNH